MNFVTPNNLELGEFALKPDDIKMIETMFLSVPDLHKDIIDAIKLAVGESKVAEAKKRSENQADEEAHQQADKALK